MAGEMAQGAIGGALSGAGAGAQFGPWGAGVGAGIGLIGGLMQGANQRKKMADYRKAEAGVNPIDPRQAAFLSKLNQQERFYRSGTDAASGFAMQGQRNALAQTQANLVRAGANPNQLLRAQGQANLGMAQVGAAASQRADALLPMQGNMTNLISERIYQRQLQNRAATLARAEQGQQDLNNLLGGGLATMPMLSAAFKRRPMQTFNPMAGTLGQQQAGGIAYGPQLPVETMQPTLPQATPLNYMPRG